MSTENPTDPREVLRDPEALAVFERNMRGAGMKRRNFLAMASAVAGAAALAACGSSSSPTATTAATVAPTKAPAAAAPTTAAPSAAAAATTVPAAATTAPAAAATAPAASVAAAATAPAATAAPAGTKAASSAAAGSPVAATGPDSTKAFIDWLTSEPVDNDFNRDLYCNGVSQHMVGLLTYDQDFNLVPELAESYTNSGPVFTYKLRKGVTWSDGVPITAKDFVYSIRRMIDPRTANGYGSFWDGVIKGASDLSSAKADAANLDTLVAAVGVKRDRRQHARDHRGQVRRVDPHQSAYVATVVAREDIVKKFADAKGVSPWTDPGKTGGPVLASGPFQITAWKHNQQIDLVRNDKYWNAAKIKQKYVSFKIVPDLTKSTLPYENGDMDYPGHPGGGCRSLQERRRN